jgi:tetratricopeptide (TPR) repeat protein
MGTRRITRKEMKQDEFVSTVGQMTRWVEDHMTKLLWGAAGLVVIILLGYAIWSWRARQAMEGHAALSVVVETYAAPVGSAAPATPGEITYATAEEKFRTVMAQADEVIEEHGSTDAGPLARLYRGLAAFELGEAQTARSDLGQFLGSNPSHFLAPQVQRKLAELDERDGNLERACATYRELTERPTPGLPTELSLLDLGRCLAAQGQRQESSATYQRILDEFPDSVYTTEARESLLKLEEG